MLQPCYNPLVRVVTTPPWVVTTTLVVTTPVIMGCKLSVHSPPSLSLDFGQGRTTRWLERCVNTGFHFHAAPFAFWDPDSTRLCMRASSVRSCDLGLARTFVFCDQYLFLFVLRRDPRSSRAQRGSGCVSRIHRTYCASIVVCVYIYSSTGLQVMRSNSDVCLYVRGAWSQPRSGLDASTPQPRRSLDVASMVASTHPRCLDVRAQPR